MYSLFCCRKKRCVKIALIGLDSCGKTSLVYLMKDEIPLFVSPTFGFSNHSIFIQDFDSYDISIYDLGGSPSIRGYWSNYYSQIHCIIFVIDVSRMDRFHEVFHEYSKMVKCDQLLHKPLLFICNKCDLLTNCEPNVTANKNISKEILKELNFNSIAWPTDYHIIQTSAKLRTKESLNKGLQWLMTAVHNNYKQLNALVKNDHHSLLLKEKSKFKIQKQRVQAWMSTKTIAVAKNKSSKTKYITDNSSVVNDEISSKKCSSISFISTVDMNDTLSIDHNCESSDDGNICINVGDKQMEIPSACLNIPNAILL